MNRRKGQQKRTCHTIITFITRTQIKMKLSLVIVMLTLSSGCHQSEDFLAPKSRKIVIHTFTGEGMTRWYYIKKVNGTGGDGYYLQSEEPVANFNNANFIYCKMRPNEFKEHYPSNEKIILVDAKDLVKGLQKSNMELESLTINTRGLEK